ncbi:MAG: FAD-dependent oxidoreductase [Leptospiraceae bacterium]|nr:FAD-dependent oxidoreductase [Leptospiraceae bacterium]
MKIGIVGSGISGLGAAYYLKTRYGHDVEIFEKNDYVGGHTNTIEVEEEGRIIPVDTGFIVFNERTYPELISLFAELDVESQESDMSFSVWNLRNNLQWSGIGMGGLFAQKRNALNPRYLSMLMEAKRFFDEGARDIQGLDPDLSIGQYLQDRGYSKYFCDNFLVPMASAVWSTPMQDMLVFPAGSLLRFFKNHGMLDIERTVVWRTLVGGSWSYVRALRERAGLIIHSNSAVTEVHRTENGATVATASQTREFDAVILACHSDQVGKLYRNMPDEHRSILSNFKYQPNQAILHSDEKAMPPKRKAWASWNFKVTSDERTCTVYWMNKLQNLHRQGARHNYMVSINEFQELNESKVHQVINYEHPLFDVQAVNSQKDLLRINEEGPVHYCGAYFRYGFHEDGLWSGLKAAAAVDESLQRKEAAAL